MAGIGGKQFSSGFDESFPSKKSKKNPSKEQGEALKFPKLGLAHKVLTAEGWKRRRRNKN